MSEASRANAAKAEPEWRDILSQVSTSMDLAKITKKYNKLLDSNEEPFSPGTFKRMQQEAKDRLASGRVSATPTQAQRIDSFLKQKWIHSEKFSEVHRPGIRRSRI